MGRLKRLALWCCAALMAVTVGEADPAWAKEPDRHSQRSRHQGGRGRHRGYVGCATILLTTLMLTATACSATDDTPAPGGDTTATPDNPTAPANPITESTISAPSSDQGSEEVASIVFNYPEWLLTNDNDSPTPLGRLCWAVQEYMLMEGVLFSQVMEDKNPGYEVVFPDISSTDDDIGPVGSVNEEYPTIGTDDYFSNTLGAIQESAIVATVNDNGLSEELQLFAQEFFIYVAAFNNQLKAGGYENIDQATLPYQNFDDFPHVEEFTEAIEANPDKCKFPTIEEAEKEIAKFDQYVTEN